MKAAEAHPKLIHNAWLDLLTVVKHFLISFIRTCENFHAVKTVCQIQES